MSKNTTQTARIDALEARMDGIESKLDLLVARVVTDAPAKVERKKPAKKAASKAAPKKRATKKAPAKKAPTKGSQAVGALSRSEWNRTLTAKARLAGGDTYKRVIARWGWVQEQRNAGFTPDQVLRACA